MNRKDKNQMKNVFDKNYATLFAISYNNKKVFFSPFFNSTIKMNNLADPLYFYVSHFSFIKNKNSPHYYNDFIFNEIKKTLDEKSDIFYDAILNIEDLMNLYFYSYRKINKYIERKNHQNFLCFLKSALFMQKLKKDEYLSIFSDAKVLKIRIKKELEYDRNNKLKKDNYVISEYLFENYLNRFIEITKKYGVCPLKMSNSDVNCNNICIFMKNRTEKDNEKDNALDFALENLGSNDVFQKNYEKFENPYSEIFKRFFNSIVIFKSALGKNLYSYEKAFSFLSNRGKNQSNIMEIINNCKFAISGEKKNAKKMIIHNFKYFETFFSVFMKTKENGLENFLSAMGINENGLRSEKLPNGKTFKRITITYDLDFIKEMATLLD